MKKMVKRLLIAAGILFVLLLMAPRLVNGWLGEAADGPVPLAPGNLTVPHERTLVWNAWSPAADSSYAYWARQPLQKAQLKGKGNIPRILLAKLLTARDIPLVNSTIKSMTVWGISGSSWALNKHGDYDFTITQLTTILCLFGDQPNRLYPATKNYLLQALLTEDGNHFRTTAPRTLGLVRETENHILMTEGSRYLKNRWISMHGDKDPYYDNLRNGMEKRLSELLEGLLSGGLYEFNSRPYAGYTIEALLNLEAFASDPIRRAARDVLDYMNWCYALGSYGLKHYPPMRRRYDKAGLQGITDDYQSIYMKAWLSYTPLKGYDRIIRNGEVHFLTGACMPYRPADQVVKTIFDKDTGYFVRLGHGPGACPEIYAAGKHFLLSAGGVNRGERSLIVARPITLFLDDTATQLRDVFHLAGPGTDYMDWNNTGVYRNFACAAGPVYVPAAFSATAKRGDWHIYAVKDSLWVVIYSTDRLGLIAVREDGWNGAGPAAWLDDVIRTNPDPQSLQHCFQFPGGRKLMYDVHAPRNKWVIIPGTSEGGEEGRHFDAWPLIESK